MESLKTITFEDGEQYAVNAPAYEVSGELVEESQVIDFAVLPAGLREITVITKGKGTSGDYYHLEFNGTKTAFITGNVIYGGYVKHKFTRVGNMWVAEGGPGNASSYAISALNALDGELTSFKIWAYESSKFGVGTKYALEGR